MNKITLVCTRSAISASALVYMINQSPDYYNISHNNLWLNEISDRFGTAHTINDWWNVPNDFSSYTKEIRNADVLSLKQLEHLSDNIKDINLGKNIALFTHATNHTMLNDWVKTYNLPVNIVSTIMGSSSHLYVTSWLRREYNNIMNDWDTEETAWYNLLHQRTVKDIEWTGSKTLSMHEWLIDPLVMYNKLNIQPCNSINLWLEDYKNKNGIVDDFDNDTYWSEEYRGTMTKIAVMLRLVNELLNNGVSINSSQIYAKRFYEEHIADWSLSWQELDRKIRSFTGIVVDTSL